MCVHMVFSLCVCVYIFSSYVAIELGPTLMTSCNLLSSFPCLQIQSQSVVLGDRTSTYQFGGYKFSPLVVRKDMIMFSGCPCFLEWHCLPSAYKQVLVLSESVASWGWHPLHLPNIKPTYLYFPWVSPNSSTLWTHWSSVLLEHSEHFMRMVEQ